MQYFTGSGQGYFGAAESVIATHWRMILQSINLIASACYPFPEAMLALAEPMCVFPIEGLPRERYFPGTSAMDMAEVRAEELICGMFAAGQNYRATIQPHSGTQANQTVFNTVLDREDTVLSLHPKDGGHISHQVLVGRRNPVTFYPLGDDCRIDYTRLEEIARGKRPRLIIAGGSACPREIDFARIGSVAREVGAYLHADVSHTATLIAAGVHAPVIPHADFVTFNMAKNMRGPSGGVLLYRREHHDRLKNALFPGTQGGPNENTMLAKLVALEKLDQTDLGKYAQRMVEIARIIARVFCERNINVVTGGTDCHLVLLDLRGCGISGIEAEQSLAQWGVLVNRNLIPDDPQKASVASGIRLGTSCLTILEYSNCDVERLTHWIADRIQNVSSADPKDLIDELINRYNRALLPHNLTVM